MVNKGSFTLSGGSITGNTTNDETYGSGGGVCLYGTFYLSGDSIIQDNRKAGATDNLYLGWKTINITGPLGENAHIGVNAENVPRSFISGWSNNMAGKDPADYFSSDGDACGIGLNTAGDVVLGNLCTTITLNPNGGTLPEYSFVEGAALPIPTKTGYTFAGWYENQELTGVPVADIPTNSTENLNFYAKWTVNTYTISVVVTPENAGTVMVNGSGTSTTVVAGTEVTLSATANSGYHFVAWVENGQTVSSNNPYTFTVNSSHTLNAKFERLYTVTVGSTAGGTATGGGTYTEGDTVTLTATPNAGYRFVGWVDQSGQSVSSDNPFTFVATSDSTLTAKFEQVYTVTVNVSGNGTATGGGSYAEGETVTLSAQANQGYRFTGWTSSNGGTFADASSESTTFTMPAGDVTVTAGFTRISSGSTTPSKTPSQQATDKIEAAKAGDTVTVNLTTGNTKLNKEVFEKLSGKDVTLEIKLPGGVMWTVNGQDIPADADLTDLDMGVSMNTSTIPVNLINAVTGEAGTVQLTLKHNGEFGFKMMLTAPVGVKNAGLWANLYHYDEDAGKMVYQAAALVDEDGNVALPFDHASQYALVLDSKSHDLPFTDLAADAWYTDAVAYVYRHDLMAGYGENLFGPDDDLSRAQLCQIIYNMEGQPDLSDENLGYPYEDVDAQAWYGDAVYWARITGVATGYGDGTFQPTDSITRQEFAQMLYNYAKYKGYDLSVEGDLSQFPDSGSVADWAEAAMIWANGNQLINGHDDGTIDAGGIGTRAQAASILMRFDQNLVEK